MPGLKRWFKAYLVCERPWIWLPTPKKKQVDKQANKQTREQADKITENQLSLQCDDRERRQHPREMSPHQALDLPALWFELPIFQNCEKQISAAVYKPAIYNILS